MTAEAGVERSDPETVAPPNPNPRTLTLSLSLSLSLSLTLSQAHPRWHRRARSRSPLGLRSHGASPPCDEEVAVATRVEKQRRRGIETQH